MNIRPPVSSKGTCTSAVGAAAGTAGGEACNATIISSVRSMVEERAILNFFFIDFCSSNSGGYSIKNNTAAYLGFLLNKNRGGKAMFFSARE
jgi:hypothetical protein